MFLPKIFKNKTLVWSLLLLVLFLLIFFRFAQQSPTKTYRHFFQCLSSHRIPTTNNNIHKQLQPANSANNNNNNNYGYQSNGGQRINQSRLQASTTNSTLANCKRVCYFRMDPKTEIRLNQVDGALCTHVILAFCRIGPKGQLIFGNNQTDECYLNEVEEFKRRNPGIKVMVSVYNELEFNGFPRAAQEPEIRQTFARSTIEFLKRYNLDGIDLDWEFPNFPTTFRSRDYERIGFTKILKSLRSVIVENFYDRQVAELNELQLKANQQHQVTSNPTQSVEPYLLTIAISGQENVLRASYELKQLANLCDWFNVMSYDYYLFKTYTPFTGPNSPLQSIVSNQVPILNKLSYAWTINKLIKEEEIPAAKIVMGIPTYARAYRLMFKNTQPTPFSLAIGTRGGQIEDYFNYREVCDILEKPETIVEFDSRARVPYLLTDNGYTWISYENSQSVREKVRLILKNQLAGYMTWNLNSDDFVGRQCRVNRQNGFSKNQSNDDMESSGVTFPLHRAMLDELGNYDDFSSSVKASLVVEKQQYVD